MFDIYVNLLMTSGLYSTLLYQYSMQYTLVRKSVKMQKMYSFEKLNWIWKMWFLISSFMSESTVLQVTLWQDKTNSIFNNERFIEKFYNIETI